MALFGLMPSSFSRNLGSCRLSKRSFFSWILTFILIVAQTSDACNSFGAGAGTDDDGITVSPPPEPTAPSIRKPPQTKPPQWYSDPVGSELRFIVMGDFGGQGEPPYTTYDQVAVAKAAGKIADNFKADFVVELGDNFYDVGVKNVDDPRFQRTFEDVFTADSLQIPWYIAAGNHDWEGNITAQIEYSNISERWNFPHHYYSKEFPLPGSSTTKVALLVIDTILLCGMGNETLPGSPPTGPSDVAAAEEHWVWIQRELELAKQADYILVAGHYPVWSVGYHGPTQCLVKRLNPLLKQYNVSAYFGGHDHNLQHIHEEGSSVEHIVSGGGHLLDPSAANRRTVPPDWQRFFMGDSRRKGGFVYAEATPERMTIAFTDAKDIWDLYTMTILPRQRET